LGRTAGANKSQHSKRPAAHWPETRKTARECIAAK
jgi:hypothetical protein